jgi:uncharacterized protein YdhG (YjbR/CyaY superfamily)
VNADVKRYLAAVPDNRKPLVERLHGLIVGLYPEAAIDMSYRIPTYKVGQGWVALANQKRYVSLYTCGAHHLAEFKKKYPRIKTGTGCINFRLADEFTDTAIEQVIEHAIEHPKG